MRGSRVTVVFVLAAAGLVALGCSQSTPGPTASPTPAAGGTLRIAYVGEPGDEWSQFVAADPALPTRSYLQNCCLARTLLTYPGLPTEKGGATLVPDLAVAMPEIADDSMSWTFRLRQGIHYAPPYDALEVTSADFVTAAERNLRVGETAPEALPPYAIVDGATEFAAGEAPTIRGLETPDKYTLVVRLVEPTGSLNWVTDVSWAPIPAQLATEHGGPAHELGRYWASTGPYMYETYPADPSTQTATLVRNPAWQRATDPRRGAWVDRIDVSWLGEGADAFAALDNGEFDFSSNFTPGEVLDRYRADPALAPRVRTTGTESIWWLPMNLAVPPFDDPAVRRAVNAVINRAGLVDLVMAARAGFGPQPKPVIPGHVFPDSLTSGLLIGYDPFPSRGHTGDLARARTEMSSSRYDTDHDGECDAAVCTGLQMPAEDPAIGNAIRDDLARIGLDIEVVPWNEQNDMVVVTNHVPLQANVSLWGYSLAGDELVALLRGGPGFAPDGFTLNSSLVGAPADDLARWGYTVTNVPTLDDVIDRCKTELGHLRARCYAELDQLVSEAVVPWVPVFSFERAHISSPHVASFDIDQSVGYPALDQVVLAAGQ